MFFWLSKCAGGDIGNNIRKTLVPFGDVCFFARIHGRYGHDWMSPPRFYAIALINQLSLGLVPQMRWLFQNMSVDENLQMGCYLIRGRAVVKQRFELVYSLFPILKQRHNQLARTLSGGQAQMLTIARALMSEPKMLLLDEPSAGLAPAVVDELYEVIRKLKEEGLTLLIVEQDVMRALTMTERSYVLQRGRIVMQDTSEKLLSYPSLIKRYLTSC